VMKLWKLLTLLVTPKDKAAIINTVVGGTAVPHTLATHATHTLAIKAMSNFFATTQGVPMDASSYDRIVQALARHRPEGSVGDDLIVQVLGLCPSASVCQDALDAFVRIGAPWDVVLIVVKKLSSLAQEAMSASKDPTVLDNAVVWMAREASTMAELPAAADEAAPPPPPVELADADRAAVFARCLCVFLVTCNMPPTPSPHATSLAKVLAIMPEATLRDSRPLVMDMLKVAHWFAQYTDCLGELQGRLSEWAGKVRGAYPTDEDVLALCASDTAAFQGAV
jgi:hypothetical protein